MEKVLSMQINTVKEGRLTQELNNSILFLFSKITNYISLSSANIEL